MYIVRIDILKAGRRLPSLNVQYFLNNKSFIRLKFMTQYIFIFFSVCEDYVESRSGYFVYDSVTSTKVESLISKLQCHPH